MHIRESFTGRTLAREAQDRETSCPDEPTGNHDDVSNNHVNTAAFRRIVHGPHTRDKTERTDNRLNTIRRARTPRLQGIRGELTRQRLLHIKISLDFPRTLFTRPTLLVDPDLLFLSFDDAFLHGLSVVATEKSVAGIA